MWTLKYSSKAVRQLGKLDKYQSRMIRKWLGANIDGCDDPRAHGRALLHDLSGFWRYRVGKYRVICELHDDELLVLAVEVGHRREVYR